MCSEIGLDVFFFDVGSRFDVFKIWAKVWDKMDETVSQKPIRTHVWLTKDTQIIQRDMEKDEELAIRSNVAIGSTQNPVPTSSTEQ